MSLSSDVFLRPGMYWAAALVMAVLAACSPQQPEHRIDISESEVKAPDPQEIIRATLVQHASGGFVSSLYIPAGFFRKENVAAMQEIADGEIETSAFYLVTISQDHVLKLPASVEGEWVTAIVKVSLLGVTDDYNQGVLELLGGKDKATVPYTGDVIAGAKKVKTWHPDAEREIFLAEDEQFGLVRLQCNGALQSDGSYLKDKGRCHISYVRKPNFVVTVSVPKALFSSWRDYIMQSETLIQGWETTDS